MAISPYVASPVSRIPNSIPQRNLVRTLLSVVLLQQRHLGIRGGSALLGGISHQTNVLERVTNVEHGVGVGIVGSPVRQAGGGVGVRAAGVGVASLDKVGPVGRDDALDVKVVVGKRVGVVVGVQRVEHVHDFGLVESALALSWGRVVPEVGPDGRGGVGFGDPVGGVHPLRDGAEVEGGEVEGGGGGGGGVAGGVEVEVVLGQVAKLEGHDLIDVSRSEVVGGGRAVLVVGASGD